MYPIMSPVQYVRTYILTTTSDNLVIIFNGTMHNNFCSHFILIASLQTKIYIPV